MKIVEQKILDHAVGKNLLDDTTLEKVRTIRDESGEGIDQVMVRLKVLSKEELYDLLEEMSGYPTVDPNDMDLDREILDLIPEAAARQYQVIPLFRAQDSLGLAMSDPMNFEAVDELQMMSGLIIEPFISAPMDIGKALDQHYGGRQSMAELFDGSEENEAAQGSEEIEFKRIPDRETGSPVTRIVNRLLVQAIREGASDIHIEPWANRIRVRFRIDGILHDMPAPQLDVYEAIVSRMKILAGMNIAERRIPQDGRVDLSSDGKEIDLRISSYPTYFGEKIVIRLLNKKRAVYELPALGFSGESLRRFHNLIQEPHGVILVTGPTGSGKTTTLYAVLNKLRGVEKHILTIEDPIEYQMDLICQSQVNPKAGMTFSTGLRAILRQDPDVIMVGEIRDRETAETAIHSALTGHLVLSTLHTNDSVGAVTRLTEMGVEPFLIASSIVGVLAQRLVRIICKECKESYEPGEDVLRRLGLADNGKNVVFHRGRGCASCRETGYRGRVGIYEVLVVDRATRDLISREVGPSQIRDTAVEGGMSLLREDGLSKAVSGVTSIEEVLRVTGSS